MQFSGSVLLASQLESLSSRRVSCPAGNDAGMNDEQCDEGGLSEAIVNAERNSARKLVLPH